MRERFTAWLVLLLGLAAGCGGGAGGSRHHVSGTVTYAGKPVANGRVTFDPVNDPKGMQGYAPIKDGKYDTRVGGLGTTGGNVVIRVEGYSGEGATAEEPNGKPLFSEFSTKADLPREDTTKDIVVTANPGDVGAKNAGP